MRHNPHQGASKLTKTGTRDSKTSFVNVRSLTDNTMTPLELNGFHIIRPSHTHAGWKPLNFISGYEARRKIYFP